MYYRFKVEKLIRDKTAERCLKSDVITATRILSEEEFKCELLKKLVEEAIEVEKAIDRSELISELADVFDVYNALLKVHSISNEEIEKVRNKKIEERGNFDKRIYGIHFDIPDTKEAQWYMEYCSSQPEKYPLIKKYE